MPQHGYPCSECTVPSAARTEDGRNGGEECTYTTWCSQASEQTEIDTKHASPDCEKVELV